MGTIRNASAFPITTVMGTTPDVSGALQDYYQTMTFEVITKTVQGFQVVETTTPVTFRGVLQPLKPRELELKPEGERAWTWFWLHADPALILNVDDVVLYKGVQTRVMAKQDCYLYGYVAYQLVQDWTGAGPST